MKMSSRGVVFALVSRRATVEFGANSRKGVSRQSIVELANQIAKVDAATVQKALEWLSTEGYITLNTKTIIIRNAGWELADRYVRALKKWYNKSKPNPNAA